MKIVIEINIQAIVEAEIRQYVRENLSIVNVSQAASAVAVDLTTAAPGTTVTVSTEASESEPPADGLPIAWEYAPRVGKRRNQAEIKLHKKELELGRLLTPAEKGIEEAHAEIADEAQEQAKADTKNQARIDGMAEEGMAAASQELADEAAQETGATATETTEEATTEASETEAEVVETQADGDATTIPTADDLGNLNSLFT